MNKPAVIKNQSVRVRASWRFIVHRVGRDPWMDWLIVFSIAFLLTVVLSCIGALSYMDLGRRLTAPIPKRPGSSLSTVDTVRLQRILDAYEAKAASRAGLSRGYAGPADPSR